MSIFTLYVVLGPSWSIVSASDGDLDLAFGAGGHVINQVPGDVVVTAGVVIQPDGKIVSAATVADNHDDMIVLTRNNQDGSLDSGFGSGGTVTTLITGDDFARAIALQSDGKIVVAGDISADFGQPSFVLLRYNSDGSLDTGFGTGGQVTTRVGRVNYSARAVCIQPDGKILAAGFSTGATLTAGSIGSDFALVRYSPDGGLDSSFGTAGIVTTSFPGSMFEGADLDSIDTIAIQPDGKVLAAGEVVNGPAQSIDSVLIRYGQDGSIDTAFGDGGKVVSRTGTLNYPKGIVVQSDLKIVVGGQSWTGSPRIPQFLIARYNPDGSVDASFGADGNTITGLGLAGDQIGDKAFALAPQSDGKIVEVGSAGLPVSTFAVARFNRDGHLDPAFGTRGISTVGFPGQAATAAAVAIQKDGEIVTAGAVQFTQQQRVLALARFESTSAKADFAILPDPQQVDVTRGTKVPITINISRNGAFQGAVQISPPDTTGTGIKVKPPSPVTTNGNSVTYKLKITGAAAPGAVDLSFAGTDASGGASSTTVRVVVH